MMLSKVSRNFSFFISKSDKNIGNLKSIILLGTCKINKRDFSIDEIGKRNSKPFDYKKKQYGLFDQITDSTYSKLGENSIIITVEGNFGAGKSEFAKNLAEKIDFVYAREPDLDAHMFLMPNGTNFREVVNEYVGDNKKYHLSSVEEWHKQPSFKKSIQLQTNFYKIRWMQTRTALLHLMSTGQGVVLERSVFSDAVIGQSLYDNHFLSDAAYKYYLRDLTDTTISELWKPHVVIYLDKSPEDCLKTIKEKGKPFEKESQVYSLSLLKSMDKIYKNKFLPLMRNDLHVLTYDNKEVNIERTIEDLERLDFEDLQKFHDWRVRKETHINLYRKILADYNYCVRLLESPDTFINVPELLLDGDDLEQLRVKLSNDPRLNNKKGFSMFSPMKKNLSAREWF